MAETDTEKAVMIDEEPKAAPAPTKTAKRGQEIDWTQPAPVRAFEPVGTVVKFIPPGSPQGFMPYLIECDLSAIAPEDLEQYERDLDTARLRTNRKQYLTKQLAECKDIGDPDNLDEQPGDEQAQAIRAEIAEWEARADSMNININSILMPAGMRWNLADPPPALTPIPLEQTEIRKRVSLQIVTGLSANIVKAINGDTSVIVGKKELAQLTKRVATTKK